MIEHNFEHSCDECGKDDKSLTCLCERDLDDRLQAAFEDGKKEGKDEGYNQAKEEIENNEK